MAGTRSEVVAITPGDFAAYALIVVTGMSVVSMVAAVARRIGGPRPGSLGAMTGGASQAAIDQLRDEVEQLRAELSDAQARLAQVDELHERLDFAERMLAQAREKHALPEPR